MSDADRQSAAPLLEQLHQCANACRAAFHTPGHKRGQGISETLQDWFGLSIFQADLPELPELDNLFAPEGVIQEAQDLAAEAFGAEATWFLANGSTCGIEAAVLATCHPGDKILLPRNVHRSAIAALILAGAVPVFISPDYDPDWDMAHGVTPNAVASALEQHPDIRAILLVSPTYYGTCGHIKAIASLAHQQHIPLLVDEAHGSHFAFHPNLPATALQAGADLAVQSSHKTLSALTQASMLHVQGNRIDRDRLRQALQLVQSTSPSYLLLASLDAARQQMATQGKELMTRTLALADRARTELSQIPGLSVLSPDYAQTRLGVWQFDRTRLTVDVTGLGLTGFAADELLHQDLGVTAELPVLRHLTFILSFGNTVEDIDRLIHGFQTIAAQFTPRCPPAALPPVPLFECSLPSALTPRQAFFADSIAIPIHQSVNQVSAELVCPYPPGIPVLVPGEVITNEAIEYLRMVQQAGGTIAGCADTSPDPKDCEG